MAIAPPERPLAGGAVAVVASLAAVAAGDPLIATALGLIGGGAAVLVAWRPNFALQGSLADSLPAEGRGQWARRIVSAVPEPMMLVDQGRILVANPSAQELLGGWIEGQDVRLALRHPAAVERLSRTDVPPERLERLELTGIGDTERPWLISVAVLEDGARLVHLADRSEARAAERMRVDFVANASHELRTPLATILGFIETLEDDSTAEDGALRKRFLAIMQSEARRMQQLIEDLLSLSRIEAERFRVPTDEVDLVSVIEEVRDGLSQLLAQRGASVLIENEGRPAVLGDRGQLLQLVRNLVSNAVKYGREGGEVIVRIDDSLPRNVGLSVIDQGEGIEAEHLPRLTERFYRVDAGRSRSVGGTGLGLAIVKHVVERHRGRLDIRSTVGEGTKVAIWLPRPSGLSSNRHPIVT